MRKIEKTNEKSNRTLGYALLGVGAAALVGAVTALVVKSKKEDRRFLECLAEALSEEFEAAASGEDGALRVIIVDPNKPEDCNCDCDCCCCCCEYACDCDCCECCECENDYECTCECDKASDVENACESSDSTNESCEPAHDPDCTCGECRAAQATDEELASEIKLERPARKSKKQPE